MLKITPIESSILKQYSSLCAELFGSKPKEAQLKATVKKILDNPDYILVGVIGEENQLLGSVMGITCMDTVGECRPFMILENLIVSEKNRRKGIGKKLVEYIEEKAREQNCYFIMLMSLMKRKEAHKFYESLGYSTNISQGYKKYL